MLNFILLLVLVSTAVLWFAVKWYKVNNVGKRGGYLLIPCKKNTTELEHIVKSCYWEEFFQPENYGREIILVQLDKSEINYLSRRLEQDYSIVHCVDITELSDFIKRRELKCHEK